MRWRTFGMSSIEDVFANATARISSGFDRRILGQADYITDQLSKQTL